MAYRCLATRNAVPGTIEPRLSVSRDPAVARRRAVVCSVLRVACGPIVPGAGLAAVARHGIEVGPAVPRGYRSNATGFDNVPTPETVTSTTSPSARYCGGTRESPTPPGVPVAITSPASSVIPFER